MSRQDFFLLSLSLCRNPICYVAIRPLFFVLESLSRHIKVCCDFVYQCSAYLCVATLRSLSRHRNISSTLSMSQHWIPLLRPGQLTKQASHVATLFICRNQSFFFLQRHDIHHLVVTDTSSFSVAIYIT